MELYVPATAEGVAIFNRKADRALKAALKKAHTLPRELSEADPLVYAQVQVTSI